MKMRSVSDSVRTLYVSVFHSVFRLYFTCCMSALFKPSHDFTCLRRLIPFTSERYVESLYRCSSLLMYSQFTSIRYLQYRRLIPFTSEFTSIRQKAVSLYRALNFYGQEQRKGLADALHNYGVTPSNMGWHDDALSVEQDAISLYRNLNDDGQEQKQHLADALHNYGVTLSKMGRHEDALGVKQEAVSLYRALYVDPVNRCHSSNPSSPLPTNQIPALPAVIEGNSVDKREKASISLGQERAEAQEVE